MLLLGLACATVIFVWSPLFKRLRDLLPSFFNCAMCVGFWIGLVGSFTETATIKRYFLQACIVSVGAFFLSHALHLIDSHIKD